MALGLKGLGLVDHWNEDQRLAAQFVGCKEGEKKDWYYGRTEARLAVCFRTLGIHEGGEVHRSLVVFLLGSRMLETGSVRCIEKWIEILKLLEVPKFSKIFRLVE